MAHINRLDEEFADMLIRMENLENNFNKHSRIRIQQWLKKLTSIMCNDMWKRNRNNYAGLLLSCMQSDNLIEPFSRMPPQGSLPNLK
jgi:hypothetical protein